MDCEKRWQENSVIATLMGFNELPSQQTFHGNNRVLSESYLCKAASIGLRPGSSISNRRSSRRNSDILNGVKGVSEVQLINNKDDLIVEKCANSCTSNMDRVSRQERRRSKFEHLFMSPSCLENGSKNQRLNKWKTAEDVRALDEVLVLTDEKSKPRNVNHGLVKNGSRRPVFSSIKGVPDDEFEAIGETRKSSLDLKQDGSTRRDDYLKEQTNFQRDVLEPLFRRDFEQLNQDEMGNISDNDIHREIEVKQIASNSAITIYPYVQDVFSQEASLNELSSIGPPKFQDDLKRTNQHSPDSVLDPLGVQNYSSFEHFESIGLKLQLQALNLEPEETYSEGSVMAISDDEENIDDEGKNVKKWLGDDQSRNFSYMVDVLDEAKIFGAKSFMDFKKWHSMECPVSPFVFEALEKIYGKQTTWLKSERQLLFDRINSGLGDIFYPIINFHVSVKTRACFGLRCDEVEDAFWMMLIGEEKETNKDYLCEKDLGKWVDFEEGIDIICRELETPIFDEIVMELVSLWDL